MAKKITINELKEAFSLFDDWEGRYAYLIELGERLPPMNPVDKSAANRVEGCISQVWLVIDKADDHRFHITADSDAAIVKGLIAVVLALLDGKTAGEIAAVDVDAAFAELGLKDHISPNRRNGFFAMVSRIRALSGAAA